MKEEYKEKLPNGKPRCQEGVTEYWSNWPRFHQCERAATVGNKCKHHSPEYIKAKRDKQDLKFAEEQKKRRYEWHGKEFYDTLKAIADGHNDAKTLAQEVIDKFEKR